MYSAVALAVLSGLSWVGAQNPPAATPSNAVLVMGDASYDGPVIPGTTGKLGDSPVVPGNPAGASYRATLLEKTTSGIRGYLTASTAANGTGVDITLSLSGLPDASLGPFLYHIHAAPIPADGNCSKAGKHLDPYERGAIPPCDSTEPYTCQVGDTAGKHGNITSSPFSASYYDPYISLTAGNKASLVGKSFVVHSSNTTRLNCGNFELVSSSTNSTNSTTNTTTSTGTPVPFTPSPGGAVSNFASVGAVAAGVIGLVVFFW